MTGEVRGVPLHVLHLAHVRWYNAEAQYALDLAVQMQRRGHQVTFFAQAGSPAARRARESGIETGEEAGFNAGGVHSLRAVGAALRLRRFLRQRRFDAVEVHRPEALPLVAWACRSAGVPAVRVRGDMRPVRSDPLNRGLYTRWLSGIVASNSTIESSLRKRLGAIAHLATIPGGVDPQVFRPEGRVAPVREELDLPAEAYVVGILGRLGAVKGHEHFLAAAKLVLTVDAEAAFVVLAKESTPREAQLRAVVHADPVLRGRVRFLGHRPDLPAVLRAFDLGVVASTGSEANCRVGLEWMSTRVPLLATRVGALPDLVEEGRTGFLVPPASPEALGERIVHLSRNRTRSREMGAAARARVLERFTLDRCASAHEAFLREAIRRWHERSR